MIQPVTALLTFTLSLTLTFTFTLGEQHFDCGFQSMTNPEKGSYGACDLTHATNDYSAYGLDTGTDGYGDPYRYDYTLCYGKIVLSSFLNSTIDASTLALIDQHLEELKVAGTKPIVRIIYANDSGEPDTSLAWVEVHLQQLQSLFEKHSDIIAWFQGGIIGAWGEWHSSTSGLDTDENKVAVYDLLHTYLPTSPCLKVQVRYPMIMSSLVPDEDLLSSDEDAFNDSTCTKAQRLGFHNDCWMSSWHDTGTYKHEGSYDKTAREYWMPYLENVTRYSPYGGETCVDTTTGSIWTEFNCSFIFAEAEALHATFLNPQWHPEVTKYMQNHCCWEEFVERSGYRFELRGAQVMATEVSVGGSLSYSFDIENTGWSSLFSQRRGYVSLFQYLSRGDMQTIIVDGLLEEWVDVTDNFEDEYSPHTTAVADVSSVKLTNDAENLFILISFYNISEGQMPFSNGYFRIFFDTDSDPNTGYSVGVAGGKIGSELLLEGSAFYDQRTGSWNDGSVSMSLTKSISGNNLNVEISINRDAKYDDGSNVFGGGSVSVLVNIADTSWNLVEFSPKTFGGFEYSFHSTVDVVARYNHDLGSDLRLWQPNRGIVTVIGSLQIPADFKVSENDTVTVGLWFPDASSSLENNTRLSVQLASTISGGYWDVSNGVNMLPHHLTVTVPPTCFTISYSTTGR